MQFLYATGVVVLLIAALFLALEWEYARELFGVGLLIEIVVFLLSAIDPAGPNIDSDHEHGPPKEISFPPRLSSKPNPTKPATKAKPTPESNDLSQSLNQLQDQMQRILDSNQGLRRSIDTLERDQRQFEQQRINYTSELEEIRRNIARTQEQLKELSKR